MKRELSKSRVAEAKKALYKSFPSRIIKNANKDNCWHLKSIEGDKIVDFLCYFNDKGTKKVFFKIKRFAYEYFHGKDLPDHLLVYSRCGNEYCLNPDHHYTSTLQDYAKDLRSKNPSPMLGKKHKPQTIALMSKVHKGKTIPESVKKKMSESRKGYKCSDQERANMSLLVRGEKNPIPIFRALFIHCIFGSKYEIKNIRMS